MAGGWPNHAPCRNLTPRATPPSNPAFVSDLRTQLQESLGSAYTIERELGGGGMSRVFVAEEAALGRKVVVKVVPPEMSAGVNVERFRREIQVSAKLQHAHIVPVLATGEISAGKAGAAPYYTMPFVEGESLRSRLLRTGALSITDAVSILRDVARALAYAHDHGVAHRDIKPDNILLAGGSAVVADFGIAKAMSAARGEGSSATLTQIGTSLGTPAYMSPEQAAADPDTNHRADIYAFGCVAYELLAGRPPFVEKTPQRLLAAQMSATPQPILSFRPDTPAPLAELIMRCLEKEAGARPQSATELVRVLETVTSGSGHVALPPILIGGVGSFRRALLLYVAAFAGVSIVAKGAITIIGLPDWVLPGAVFVMLLGLPVILFTGYVQRVTRQAITMTPTFTPGGTARPSSGTMATLAMKASPHLSWRQTWRGGLYTLSAFVLLVAVFMVLRVMGIGPAGTLLAAGRLSEDATLVVSDFDMRGSADTALGNVVAEALRTDLSQSHAVNVMQVNAVKTALRRMQAPAGARFDLTLAQALAQREGAKAIVSGDVTPVGQGFIVSLRLVAAQNGDELAAFHRTANTAADLIPTIEKLSRDLRGKIGESLRSVRASPALGQVTTSSIDALRKFTEADALSDNNSVKAIALLKEAVAIDTGFAMAWRKLGVLYGNGGYPRALRDSAVTRAWRTRTRMTEDERLGIEAYYYLQIAQDRARTITTYEQMISRPDVQHTAAYYSALHNLALQYEGRRDWTRAESLYRAALREANPASVTYQNLAGVLYNKGDFRGADSVLDEGDKKLNKPTILLNARALVADGRGDLDSAPRGARRRAGMPTPDWRGVGHYLLGSMDAVQGKLRSQERHIQLAEQADSMRGADVNHAGDSAYFAWQDAWYRGDNRAAIRKLDAALASMPVKAMAARKDATPFFVAAVYAASGRPDRARAVIADYDAIVGRDTMRGRIDEGMRLWTMAQVAMADQRYADALKLFRQWDSGPDGPRNACAPCGAMWYGRVFDLMGQADSAIAEYQRFSDTPFSAQITGPQSSDEMFRAATYKRLGELYEAKNDTLRAVQNYSKFVNLWKDADPELQPKVAEVRKRLSRLQRSEGR